MEKALSAIYRKLELELREIGLDAPCVYGDGNLSAKILLIGEAPGKDEVAQGKPFVGRAGKNLTEFLAYTGLSREQLFITNVVKFRPYKVGHAGRLSNRPPTRDEIAACSECLKSEVELISPDVVVTLGNTALRALLGERAQIGALHGRMVKTEKRMQIFPLYHPASIIYNPSLKETYYADLDALSFWLTANL